MSGAKTRIAVRRDRTDAAPYRWAVLSETELPGSRLRAADGQHAGLWALELDSLGEAMRTAYELMEGGLVSLDDREVPYCPDCGWDHDPLPCMDEGNICECCTALLGVLATADRLEVGA